jgi:hypothetical protein
MKYKIHLVLIGKIQYTTCTDETRETDPRDQDAIKAVVTGGSRRLYRPNATFFFLSPVDARTKILKSYYSYLIYPCDF